MTKPELLLELLWLYVRRIVRKVLFLIGCFIVGACIGVWITETFLPLWFLSLG